MTQAIAATARLALVPAFAALVAFATALPGAAEDAPKQEIEATPSGDTADGFVPPMFGAPEKRVGAGSRDLNASAHPCPDDGVAGSGETPAACAETEAAAPPAENDENAGTTDSQ